MLKRTKRYLSSVLSNGRNREGIRVFCYHGIAERFTDRKLERNFHLLVSFRSHIRFLRRFRVLSLAELAAEIATPTPKRKPAVVITFDDGYANNQLAHEILDAARLPWALFVSTGAVGRDKFLWPIELSLLLLHGRAEQLEILDRKWSLRCREEREAAFQAIRYPLKAMPSDARREAMECIRLQFPSYESQRLLSEFPSLQMLTWQEIRQLADAGVEIGSHGVDHEIHHAAQPNSIRQRELQQSKRELQDRLGHPCRFFAYPNGDYNSDSPSELRAANYDLAFALQNETISPNAVPYLLPRLHTPPSIKTFTRNFFYAL